MITDITELIYSRMQDMPREFDLIIPVALYAMPEKWEIRGNSLVGNMKLTSLARDSEFSTPLLSKASVFGPLLTRPAHELLPRLMKGHAVQMSVARPRLYSYDKIMIEVLSQDGWKMLTAHGLHWNDAYRRAAVVASMHDNRKYVYGVRTHVYDQKAAEARTTSNRYIHSWSSLPSSVDLADYALQLGVEHGALPVVLSFNRATYPLSLMTLRMRALRPCRLADDMQLDADLLEAEPGLTAAALIARAGTGGPALLYRLSAKPHTVEMLARPNASWSVEEVTYPVPEPPAPKLQGSDGAIPKWAERTCEEIANMINRGASQDEIVAYVEQRSGVPPSLTVAQSSDGGLEVTLGDMERYVIMPTVFFGPSTAPAVARTEVNGVLTMDDARTLPDGPPVQATDGGRPVDVHEQLDTPLATEIRAVRPTTDAEVPFVQL